MEVDNSADTESADRTFASDELLTKEAIAKMKARLPEYVINCFEAAGYDTLAVIADMDVSAQPGNSLDEIEKFIGDTYPNNPKYCRDISATSSFKFPPGHRKRICNFVNEISAEHRAKIKKTHPVGKRPIIDVVVRPETKRNRSDDPEDGHRYDPTVILGNIRRQVAKWQQSQKIQQLRELKEHEQFEVTVTLNEGSNPSVSIACKICAQKCALGFKQGNFLISNWTRHVAKCVNSPKRRGYKENNLYKYLSSPGTTASLPATGHASVSLHLSGERTMSSVEQHTPPQKAAADVTVLVCNAIDPIVVEGTVSEIRERTMSSVEQVAQAEKETADFTVLICGPTDAIIEGISEETTKEENDPFRLIPPVKTNR